MFFVGCGYNSRAVCHGARTVDWSFLLNVVQLCTQRVRQGAMSHRKKNSYLPLSYSIPLFCQDNSYLRGP